MKKILALLLALMMLATLFAGCASNIAASDSNPTPELTVESPSDAVTHAETFTDSVGRTVELPSNLTKISPSGSLSQMFLVAIAPDLMVTAASDYSDNDARFIPESVLSLPRVGAFYGTDDINYESVAATATQLVIDIGEPKKTIVEDMDSITTNLAIPAIHITATLDTAPEAFRTLGVILGREERGEALAQLCEKIMAKTETLMAKIGDDKVSALYVLGDAGLNVLAKTSFHSEVIDLMTDNLAVVDDVSGRGSGNETDLEQISLWNPEVLILAPEVDINYIMQDATWQQLDAIQSGRAYCVPMGPYNWMANPPSINRYLGMVWLAHVLYGTDYAEFSADVMEYYKLFYGYDLNDDELGELIGLCVYPLATEGEASDA